MDELDDENEESDDRANKMALHDIYSMDMERVKHSLARYLRVRILKIENMVHYIDSSSDQIFETIRARERISLQLTTDK